LTLLEVEVSLALLCEQGMNLPVTISAGGGSKRELAQREGSRGRKDDLKREGEAGEATESGAQDFVTRDQLKEREREGLCVKRA
jgi:hypothetical protein